MGFGLGVVGFGVVGWVVVVVVVGAVVVVVVVVGAAVDVGESMVGILGWLAADAPPPHAAVRMAVPISVAPMISLLIGMLSSPPCAVAAFGLLPTHGPCERSEPN